MDTTTVAILVVGVMLLIVLAQRWGQHKMRQQEGSDDLFAAQRPPLQGVDWGAIRHESVQQHLQTSKIEAIKAYRELTGEGLKESKDAIEYALKYPEAAKRDKRETDDATPAPAFSDAGIRDLLTQGKFEDAVNAYKTFAGVDYFTARNAVEAIQRDMTHATVDVSVTPNVTASDKLPIEELVRLGRKIEAIKLYREATGVGLKEAKDAIDAMERNS